MAHFKGFTAGMLAGAAVGSLVGMALDPLKDKDSKKLRQSAENFINNMGDAMNEMKK